MRLECENSHPLAVHRNLYYFVAMRTPPPITCAALCGIAGLRWGVAPAHSQVTPLPHTACNIASADLPPGTPAPTFDASAWSTFTPRTAPSFQIIIDTSNGAIVPYTAAIQSNLSAACARWAQSLDCPAGPVVITIIVRIDNAYLRATARSEATVVTGTVENYDMREQGAAYEVRTGIDPNGTSIDAVVTLNQNYLADELWFDPDPATRSAPAPANRTDAVSVFLHELGHILVFNGWRDSISGILPGMYMSPFDQLTTFAGDFYFQGPLAAGLYGSPVPLTFGSARHVGNLPPRPGQDLVTDLMSGSVLYRGVRYDVTPMTLGIAADCGVSLLSTFGCDTIDYNRDGLFPDTLDIDDFLSVFSGGACTNDPPVGSGCGDIDFNNDGLFPDTLDIDALLSVFSGGACV